MKTPSETLSSLKAEERSLVDRIEALSAESVALKRRGAQGDDAAVSRRATAIAELNAARQDLVDTRAAIAEVVPTVAVELAQDRVTAARELTVQVEALLAKRLPIAARIDELIAEIGAELRTLDDLYVSSQHLTMRAMPVDQALGVQGDHELVPQEVICGLLVAAGWDRRILETGVPSFGLSVSRVASPIEKTVQQQNVALKSWRHSTQARAEQALEDAITPPEIEEEMEASGPTALQWAIPA